MNVKGQALIFSLMLAVTFFFIGIDIVAPVLNVIADSARSQLTCSAPADTSIDIICFIFDIAKPYVVGVILGLAGGLVGAGVTR